MDKDKFQSVASEKIKNFSIDVNILNENEVLLENRRLHQKIDNNKLLNDLSKYENEWLWPFELFNLKDNFSFLNYDENYVYEMIDKILNNHNENCTKCKNASLSYNKDAEELTIVEAIEGNEINNDETYATIFWAINNSIPFVNINDDFYKRPKIFSDNPKLKNSMPDAEQYLGKEIEMTINDVAIEKIDSEKIVSWLAIDDEAFIYLSDELVSEYANNICRKFSTLGSQRTYIRPNGKTCSVSGGSFGFEINTETTLEKLYAWLNNNYKEENMNLECTPENSNYTGPGMQDWGNTFIDVDLNEQHAYMFKNGERIWDSSIVSGKPGENTPEGVWYITKKESPSKLIGEIDKTTNKPSYETEVKYWMPFVENSIGLHDASWQPDFGGSRWSSGFGSHGCINLPSSSAAELYNLVYCDLVVVVHY